MVSDFSKIQGYTYNRLREKVEFQLHDTSLWQLPDSSFEISSNCLFCGNSYKNYGKKGGYQLILVRIFNFQSMPSMSRRHAIKGLKNGSVVSIQEWNMFKTSMPRFMFTIFATTKNRASIHAWCWYEKKKSQSWPQSWYTESRRLMFIFKSKWWRTNYS